MAILKFLENHEAKVGRWTDLAVRQFNKPFSWMFGWGQRPQVPRCSFWTWRGHTCLSFKGLFTFNFMYAWVSIFVWVPCPWKPEGGIRFLGAGAAGGCDPGDKLVPSARAGVFITAKLALWPQVSLSIEYLLCLTTAPAHSLSSGDHRYNLDLWKWQKQ